MKKYKLTHKNNINNNKTNKNIKYLQNGGYKKTYKINNFKFIVTTKNMMDNENITELNNEISNKNNDINDIKSKDYIKITIGSGSIKCVELTINKDDPKNASLDRFDYQLDCNISKDMKRKIDTHKMMDTLILFLKNELKTDMNIDIDTITLEDGSKRPCEGTKFNIMYYDLYLFKYGMPYYNYTYGFDFYYESDKELHRENLKLIHDITIDKKEFINYLMIKHIYKDKIANHKENISEFLENIIDGIVATEFIKTYSPKEHLSYLLHYFFMYMKQISGYQSLLYVPCVKYI